MHGASILDLHVLPAQLNTLSAPKCVVRMVQGDVWPHGLKTIDIDNLGGVTRDRHGKLRHLGNSDKYDHLGDGIRDIVIDVKHLVRFPDGLRYLRLRHFNGKFLDRLLPEGLNIDNLELQCAMLTISHDECTSTESFQCIYGC